MADFYHSNKYVVLEVRLSDLEDVLNKLEEHAKDLYTIHSIFEIGKPHADVPLAKPFVCLVFSLLVHNEDPVFNEAEIKKKLGF